MKKILLLFFLAIGMNYLGWGQSIFDNPITGSNPSADNPYITGQNFNANITVSGIGRGSGISANSASNRYNASSWNVSSLDVNKYFYFTLTPNSGYKINFVSFVYTGQASGTGPTSFAIRSSLDSYVSNLGSPNATGTTIDLSASTYQNLTGSITFRFYGWNASQSAGTFSINDFTFNGTVVSTGATAPSVTSLSATAISSTGATFNGCVTADGGASIADRGFYWKTSSGVTTSDTKVSEGGTTTGAFSKTLSLTAQTHYYYKAYATNSVGTTLSSVEENFWTFSIEPASHTTTFTNNVISQTQINLNFDKANTIINRTGYIILQTANATPPTGFPVDSMSYTVGYSFTNGTGTVAAIVTDLNATSTSITGLTAGTTYSFKIFPFNWNGSQPLTYNYKTDGTVPSTSGTTLPPLASTSEVKGPALGSQPNPGTISSLITTAGAAIRVFDMGIFDYGVDGQPTKVTQVTIKAGTNNTTNWSASIQGVKLSTDGGSTFVTTGTPTINAASIVFPITAGNLNIPDNSSLTLSLYIYLKSTGLTDNQIFEFKVDAAASSHGFTADATGSTFLTTFSSAPVSNQVSINVVATKLNFVQQPTNTNINATMVPAVTIEATDDNGNRDLNKTGTVTLSSSGTMTGPVTASLSAGYGTFGNIIHTVIGTGLTLTASLAGLPDATSNSFNITLVPIFTELVVPQYMGSKTTSSANTDRTPFVVCLQIDNLQANTAYDIKPGVALTSDVATSYGAGNFWISGIFQSATISNAFTTNSAGSSGPFWIFIQPTGNSTRFDAGQVHNLRIGYIVNGGSMPSAPNFIGSKTITALDIASTPRTTTTTDDGAFIKGTANIGASGKYVLLYNNIDGTGDPLFSYQIRTATATSSTQSDLPSAINDVYLQSGTSSIGDYPAVIPIGAINPNGVRRVEARNADNTIYSYNTDADGIWYSGANTTTITSRQVVTLTNEDTPVYPTTWNGSTWDNGLPSSSKNAIVNGNLSLTDALTMACSFTINLGNTVTLNAGKNLTANETTTLNSAECLVLKSDASGTASFIDHGISGSGTTKVERYISQNQWHYTCVPMTSTPTLPLKDLYVKYYTESNHNFHYVIRDDSTLTINMMGYAIWSDNATTGDKTITFSGNLNTGSESLSLTRTYNSGTSDYDGWNLVGNPYPSSLDWDASSGWTKTNVDNAIYFWNGASYSSYVAGVPTGSNIIPPMQGFFVHATAAGTLGTSNAARVHGTKSFYKDSAIIENLLKLQVQGNGYSDETYIRFRPDATTGFDPEFDAYKLMGLNEAPQVYSTIPGTKLSINSQPFAGINTLIPVSIQFGLSQHLTLMADNLGSFRNNNTILLEDKKLNVTQSLNTNPVYGFDYTSGENPDRFLLHFNNPSFGIGEKKIDHSVQIYYYNSSVYIKSTDGKDLIGEVFIYDLTGREVYTGTLIHSMLNPIALQVESGYYIVKVVGDNGVTTGKVYLH